MLQLGLCDDPIAALGGRSKIYPHSHFLLRARAPILRSARDGFRSCPRSGRSFVKVKPHQEVIVPLSEHEQRVLDQMEHAMEVEDPRFATAMRGSSPAARQRRRLLYGGLGLLVGLILVFLGVANSMVPVAVLGFLMMIGAGALAATPARKVKTGPTGVVGANGKTTARRNRKKGRSSASRMQRLEQRWDRRRDQDSGGI